jgi:hypothetical protein
MAVHFYALEWIRRDSEGQLGTPEDLTDAVDWNFKKGVGGKTATFEVNLKNNWKDYIAVAGSRIGEVKIQADDIIKVYADVNPITKTSGQLIMVGNVMSYEGKIDSKKRTIKIKCSDYSQLILNKIPPQGKFKASTGATASSIVVDIVKQISQDENTPGVDSFNIDTTNVATTRSNSSAFPNIDAAKMMKPAYEWLNDMSQIENTNSVAEQTPGGTLIDTKSYIWYVDENNKLFWFFPDDTSTVTLTHGITPIYNIKLKQDIFDVINMVIIRGGKDKAGSGITWYHYDSTSKQTELRYKVIPKPKLADLKREELINEDNVKTTLDGEVAIADTTISLTDASSLASSGTVRINEEFVQYTGKSSNDITGCKRGSFSTAPSTHATGSNVDDAITYGAMTNEAFRDAIKAAIVTQGQNITTRYGSARWKGTIEVRGGKYTAGQIITLVAKDIGLVSQDLRIHDVHQQMTKKGWFTTLKVEEDEKIVGS